MRTRTGNLQQATHKKLEPPEFHMVSRQERLETEAALLDAGAEDVRGRLSSSQVAWARVKGSPLTQAPFPSRKDGEGAISFPEAALHSVCLMSYLLGPFCFCDIVSCTTAVMNP